MGNIADKMPKGVLPPLVMNRVKTFLKNQKAHFGLTQLTQKNWQFLSVFFAPPLFKILTLSSNNDLTNDMSVFLGIK